MKFKLRYIFIGLFALLVISLIVDLIRQGNYNVFPSRTEEKKPLEMYKIYFELTNDSSKIDWNRILNDLDYIDGQYDCADFRLATLMRIIHKYPNNIPNNFDMSEPLGQFLVNSYR